MINKDLIKYLLVLALILTGCASTYKNQNILSKQFPSVKGKNLKEEPIAIPTDFFGKNTILLIGYKQNSQFDIDRWILGLTDSGVKTKVYEIPTVVGMIPRLISGKIDSGMRSGIPNELWVDVITLYGNEAQKIAEFTGNEKPLNARVLLLDADGKVVFFHDRGYGVSYLKKLITFGI